MANRIFRSDLFAVEQGLVAMPGTITLGAGGIPSGDTLTYASASKVATGHIRLTLEDSWPSLKACPVSLEFTGSGDYHVQLSGSNMSSTANHASSATVNNIDFFILSGSAKVDVQGAKIHVISFFKNSAV